MKWEVLGWTIILCIVVVLGVSAWLVFEGVRWVQP